MSETVNRNGFPKSGNFLAFLKMFVALDESERRKVFISPADKPGLFNYCVFPAAVTLPSDSEQLIQVAEHVADIMNRVVS